MNARIDCSLTNHETGDDRVALVLLATIDGYQPALDTNADAIEIQIDTTEGIEAAAHDLRCLPADIRAAVVGALPEADGWDWSAVCDEVEVSP